MSPHLPPPRGTHHYGTAWLEAREAARHARAEAQSYEGHTHPIVVAIAAQRAAVAEAEMGRLAREMQAAADAACAPVSWPIGGGAALVVWPSC